MEAGGEAALCATRTGPPLGTGRRGALLRGSALISGPVKPYVESPFCPRRRPTPDTAEIIDMPMMAPNPASRPTVPGFGALPVISIIQSIPVIA